MKKIYSLIALVLATMCVKATTHNINISGFTYSPATISVQVGDVIIIQADATHPLVEVDATTWNANGNTPMAGGFGTKMSTYTFTATTASSVPIYYVCRDHAGMGMKGQINVGILTGLNAFVAPAENLLLFPNPASDKFSVTYSSEEEVVPTVNLYSGFGQEIGIVVEDNTYFSGTGTLRIALPVSVPSGIYFLELKQGSKKAIKKMVIN